MNAAFLTPLRVEKIGPQRWLLLTDLIFRADGISYVAPRGFQTDLASIPRLLWSLLPPVGQYDAAAVIHDAAYAGALLDGPIEDPQSHPITVTKAHADRLFYQGCRTLGVGTVAARLMYWAVRVFGDPDTHPLAAPAWPPSMVTVQR